MPVELCAVRAADIPAITAIYAEQIAGGNTYEYSAPSSEQMRSRVDAVVDAGYPYLVAERDGAVVGYAYAGSYRARAGYHWTVENSIYVAEGRQGHGNPPPLLLMTTHMTEQLPRVLDDALSSQPHRIIERDGVRYTLLGTAHVSLASVAAVQRAIGSGRYDAVAVELDTQRLQALSDPDALARLDLVQVIRKGRVALFAANLALAAYQRRLAKQLGIEPGAELKEAVNLARAQGLPVYLIDREVGLTFKRASGRLGFFGKMKLAGGLLGGLFAADEVGEEEIEKLKQGDMLEASFGDFASESPELYETVIAERDRYMATRLREEADGGQREVLAVVGAGHLAGLARHLEQDTDAPGPLRESLEYVQQRKRVPWITLGILAVIITGIGIGFWRGGLSMGADLLLQWAMYTGGMAALGCLLAGSHPLSILTAAAVAPFKPFRLSVPTGAFAALVEVHMRKPAYGDFLSLRDDAQTLRGWYRNRVSRVVLTFLLTNFGSMAGVWLAGVQIFNRLHG